MGDGTHAVIKNVGNAMFSTPSKLLHLSHILHVPKIRKTLLSISQFARENNVFFEFHQFIVWLRIYKHKMCYCGATLMRACTDFTDHQ